MIDNICELSVVGLGRLIGLQEFRDYFDRSKYLPVTEASKTGHYKEVDRCRFSDHVRGPLYSGKHLIIGGSSALHEDRSGAYTGDLSAIIVRDHRHGSRCAEP